MLSWRWQATSKIFSRKLQGRLLGKKQQAEDGTTKGEADHDRMKTQQLPLHNFSSDNERTTSAPDSCSSWGDHETVISVALKLWEIRE